MHAPKSNRIFVAILALSAVGQAFAESDTRGILQANYNKVSKLSMKRDRVNLERVVRKNASSQFEFVDALHNTMDIGATIRQNNEQISSVYKFVSNSNKITGVRQSGNNLVCTVKADYDMFLDPAGKTRIKGTSISEDTWTKTLTGWKIRRSRIIKEATTKNGIPIR